MRIIIISIISIFIVGCAASYDDNPNVIQRADVVAKNSKSIAVQHSTWGNKIAFTRNIHEAEVKTKIADGNL